MVFNPDLFQSARARVGLERENAARTIGIVPMALIAIENGEEEPSRTTLSKISRVCRRSLLTFNLSVPPRKDDRGEDFRLVVGDGVVGIDADVNALLRTVLEDDQDVQPLAFVGSASKNGDVLAAEAVA